MTRAWSRAALLLMVSLVLDSCAAFRVAAPADPRIDRNAANGRRTEVAGYTTSDGRHHSFHGYVSVSADSVMLTPARAGAMGAEAPGRPDGTTVLSRADVLTLNLHDGVSGPRTLLLSLVLLIALGTALGIYAVSQIEN